MISMNFFCQILFLFVIIYIKSVYSSNILFLFCHDMNSHIGSMMPYLKTLAVAGHNVTVLHSIENSKPPSYSPNVLALNWHLKSETDLISEISKVIWEQDESSYSFSMFMEWNEPVLNKHLKNNPNKVKELLNQHWDLLVIDVLFTNHGYVMASQLLEKRNTPYIVFSTTFVFPFQAWSHNLGGTWAGQPTLTLPTPKDSSDVFHSKSFENRLNNVMISFQTVFYCHFVLPLIGFAETRKYGSKDFTLTKFGVESAAVITDGIYGFDNNIPENNRFLVAGQYCGKLNPLPDDLRMFVEDKESKGTIYVALGSIITYDSMPKYAMNALFGAFNELSDYRIIMTFRSKSALFQTKSHIKLVKWSPQFDLLAHPKTKLFISHGGLKSLKETLCAKTPAIVLPMFAEQSRNAKTITKLGLGTMLNKYKLTKENVLNEVLKILNNNEYEKRQQKFLAMYLDSGPVSQLEKAKILTERILRKKGKNLRHNFVGETITTIEFFNAQFCALILLLIIFIATNK